MSVADELGKLDELRARGVLSDAEFQQAKQRLLDGGVQPAPALEAISHFRRSRSDRWIAGICGGLARSTGVESWIWRLIVAALLLCAGSGLVFYVLLWIFVPEEA